MEIDAETTAKVWEVRVSAGEAVEEGDVLLVLDLGGTPRPVHAPRTGRVAKVHVAAGDRVAADMDLDTALDHLHHGLTAVATTEDAAEGIAAFGEGRAPRWRGR